MKKRLFDCNNNRCNHTFEIALNDVTSCGSWCHYCANKKLCTDINRQSKFDWCKSEMYNRFLRFDFEILSMKCIIELDGPQHFEDIAYFKSLYSDRIKVDHYKQTAALNNGYHIIRIFQEDVWKDTIDWKAELISSIEQIEQSVEPSVRYISSDDRYVKWHKNGEALSDLTA